MSSPVERLKAWCDEYDIVPFQTRRGPSTLWPIVFACRKIITDYRVSKDHAAWLTTTQAEDRHKASAYFQVIQHLADALAPEEES